MDQDGARTELDGAFVAAGPDHAVRTIGDGRLEVYDLATGARRAIDRPEPGEWRTLGNLALLAPFLPLGDVSEDGRLLVSIGQQPDENGVPQRSVLLAIDLDSGELTRLAELEGRPPAATWTGDGRVLLVDRERVALLDPDGVTTTSLLEIPADTRLVAVGRR